MESGATNVTAPLVYGASGCVSQKFVDVAGHGPITAAKAVPGSPRASTPAIEMNVVTDLIASPPRK